MISANGTCLAKSLSILSAKFTTIAIGTNNNCIKIYVSKNFFNM